MKTIFHYEVRAKFVNPLQIAFDRRAHPAAGQCCSLSTSKEALERARNGIRQPAINKREAQRVASSMRNAPNIVPGSVKVVKIDTGAHARL